MYHADGGLLGELAYALGRVRGTAHCGLCDITHHGVRTKPAWKRLTTALAVPFDLVHRNERTPELAAVTEGHTPCVLAHTDGGVHILLGPARLDETYGDVDRFAAALRAAASQTGLCWPPATDVAAG